MRKQEYYDELYHYGVLGMKWNDLARSNQEAVDYFRSLEKKKDD